LKKTKEVREMDRMDFTHAVARIRVIEKKLLDKAKIERMLDAETPTEVLKILQETQYGDRITNLSSFHDFEYILKGELKEVYDALYKLTPEKSVLDILSLRYDYHNVKVIEKGKIQQKNFSDLLIPIGIIPTDELKNSIIANELKGIPETIREAIKSVESDFSESKNPQNIDIILDRFMFKDMLNRAEASRVDFIVSYVKQSIDISNIKTMLRVKKQENNNKFLENVLIDGGSIPIETFVKGLSDTLEGFISRISKFDYSKILTKILEEYNQTRKIASIEVLFDNYLTENIKKAKYVNFGAEPLIAYVIAKEMEIKVIRIIMVGKINNVPVHIISERLRELYA
jgi:V/A-type H+-transporting ATPase subunit C